MLIFYHNSYGNSKSSGSISKLGGGDFWSGAAAGFIGSGVGSATHNFKPHWQIAGSALSSGLGAKLGGGDFLQGAAMGGIIAGANHLAHRIQERNQYKAIVEKYKKTQVAYLLEEGGGILGAFTIEGGYSILKVQMVNGKSRFLPMDLR